MKQSHRVLMLVPGVLALALAVGFYLQLSWVKALWPWQDSYLSYIFLSSYAAAIGGAIIWVALSGSLAAARGGIINLGVATAGMAFSSFQFYQTEHTRGILVLSGFCLAAILGFLVFFWLIRRVPLRDARPIPLLVRISFGVFIAALIFTSTELILKIPVFPWSLRPETSVLFGWAFVGAACYFLYALFRPRWDNAGGQLLGFLLYDLVLIVPFVARIPTIDSSHALSLTVYIIVLVYSGALAIYYLFFNKSTRRWESALTASNQEEVARLAAR
ncbi:MAG TPA: hypothetical protein VH540_22465 [Ktedonobacterales bacterium]|jgi:hypothetical protein